MSSPVKDLLAHIDEIPVSKALGQALRLALAVHSPELERWCRLELGGYFDSNPDLSSDTTVPAYRNVVGRHADIYGRVYDVQSGYEFVNEVPIRFGVEELETLARTRDTVVIENTGGAREFIREHFQVDVYSFRFSSVHIAGILSAIRIELSMRLQPLLNAELPQQASRPTQGGEILLLRPSIYGIGIDLKALWRRVRGN